jgi:hypothetical protein
MTLFLLRYDCMPVVVNVQSSVWGILLLRSLYSEFCVYAFYWKTFLLLVSVAWWLVIKAVIMISSSKVVFINILKFSL